MIEKNYRREDIEISFRKYADFSTDLINSDYGTFPNNLNQFIYFCENDSIMSFITKQLHNHPKVNFNEWFSQFTSSGSSAVGSCKFMLPVDEDEKISLLYQLLLSIHGGEIKLHQFCIIAYGSGNMDEGTYEFNEKITNKLVRELGYKLEAILNSTSNKDDVPSSRLIIINTGEGSTNQIAVGNDIKQIHIPGNDELNKLLDKLTDKIISESSIKDSEREELLTHTKTLKEQMSISNPNKSIIKTILDRIKEYAPFVGIVTSILSLL